MDEPALGDRAPAPAAGVKRPPSSDGDYKIICVRLRVPEFEQFEREVRNMELTSSMALRIAARRIGGFLEIDREVRDTLSDLLGAIGQVSKGLRALHDACAAGGTVTPDQLDDQRATFGAAFIQLDALLRSILNVSHRREDGRALLTAAAAG